MVLSILDSSSMSCASLKVSVLLFMEPFRAVAGEPLEVYIEPETNKMWDPQNTVGGQPPQDEMWEQCPGTFSIWQPSLRRSFPFSCRFWFRIPATYQFDLCL